MKRITLYIVFVCALYNTAFSQTIMKPELDKFVGTWQYTQGTDTFTIILKKISYHFSNPTNTIEEILIGWHKYIKNGQLVENTFNKMIVPYTMDSSSIKLGYVDSDNYNYAIFALIDSIKNKYGWVKFKMLQSSFTQATWKLQDSPGTYIGNYDHSFTIPGNMVLTKQ